MTTNTPSGPAGGALPVLRVTDAARELVLLARDGEPDGEGLALYLEVSGAYGGAWTYDMWFGSLADAAPGDAVEHHDGLAIVVPSASVPKVAGATLDVGGQSGAENGEGGGLVILNPNAAPQERAAPAPPLLPEGADLDGPLARRVVAVLDEVINPQIAAHGGYAELVGVAGTTAFLRLGGGCQGCGLAQVTLSQGIVVAIQDAVPEIDDVVDITAHEAGTDPYYAASKK